MKFLYWTQINFSFHLKTYLSLQGVNSVICELHANKAIKKKFYLKLPKTYLKAFPVVVGSRIVLMLEDEEQIVVNF